MSSISTSIMHGYAIPRSADGGIPNDSRYLVTVRRDIRTSLRANSSANA
jgi:hypothetical protein